MPIFNFSTEEKAISFMSECSEWNNQGVKRVIFNFASREGFTGGTNAVWFECPNDEIDDDGETLAEYLARRADSAV